MDEAQWWASADPGAMLGFLENCPRASGRLFRLFACACARKVWSQLTDVRSREAVEVAERHADGLDEEDELAEAATASLEAAEDARPGGSSVRPLTGAAAVAAVAATRFHEPETPWLAASCAAGEAERAMRERGTKRASARAQQCETIRCIFGPLPFREVPVDPSWLSWNGGLVVRLALQVYEQRLLPSGEFEPARLRVLADAVEEAGGAGELLNHLREPGPHVRGCHAVDALIGRQ
jgi:hypothetical protein